MPSSRANARQLRPHRQTCPTRPVRMAPLGARSPGVGFNRKLANPHATGSPDHTAGGVDQDLRDPGIKAVRIAQPGQLAPGQDAGILGRVACIGFASNDGHGHPVQAVEPWSKQRVKRRGVAARGKVHELPVAGIEDAGPSPGRRRPSEHQGCQITPAGFLALRDDVGADIRPARPVVCLAREVEHVAGC